MHLQIRDLSKSYGPVLALDGVSLDVAEDEFVCLLGPSGCGKTTLLRVIAGLESFEQGTMTLGGKDLSAIDAQHRGFGIVFQSYSLFPNMTVAENIGYGLRIRRTPREEVERRVRTLMEVVRIPDLAARYPHQLSGGQQQRVAIARALAVDPQLLLLDEPLSALDARVRVEMRAELRDVQRRLGIPTILVTHDQEEALTMADTVVCMRDGRIEQVGSPRDLYARPATRFVADFVGTSNFLDAEAVVALGPGELPRKPEDADYLLAVRPEDLVLHKHPDGEARVTSVTFMGNINIVALDWRGATLLAELHRRHDIEPGDRVRPEIAPESGTWVAA